MKNLAVLTALTATLFAGNVAAASPETADTLNDTVKVTAIEGVGYKFELNHMACSKDKHLVTSATTTTMIAPNTDAVSQETADKLATLYKETLGKAMGQPHDAFYGTYDANEINSWKKAADEGRQPQIQPTKELVAFAKAAQREVPSFHQGVLDILNSPNVELTLNMGAVAASVPSPLCK